MEQAQPSSRWHPWLWAAIALFLLAQLIAMQFTDEVNWTVSDFAAAGLLLGGAGLAFELATRLTRDARRRVLIGGALAVFVAIVWAHGAVGIF